MGGRRERSHLRRCKQVKLTVPTATVEGGGGGHLLDEHPHHAAHVPHGSPTPRRKQPGRAPGMQPFRKKNSL